jgi:ElaB/YqjD/DUF883 family membrane-anchored ribosome-binding protein
MDDRNKSLNERWGAPAQSPERGYTPQDPAADPRTAEIRSEIEQTRGEMRETIDAIEDRLRPSRVMSRAADSVREATVGRVKEAATRAQDSFRNRSRGSEGGYGFADRIRENPIPATMAAASIAWLAFAGRRSREDGMSTAMYGSTRDGEAFVRETQISTDVDGLSEGEYPDSGRSLRDTAGMAVERARSATQDAGATLRRATSDAQWRARRLTHENTLAAGAIAAGIGLALGLAFPATERENELMGEARDSVVGRAKDAAKDAARRVQDAAGQVGSIAGQVTGTGDTQA